jgi:hypothetical protein
MILHPTFRRNAFCLFPLIYYQTIVIFYQTIPRDTIPPAETADQAAAEHQTPPEQAEARTLRDKVMLVVLV